MTCIINAYKTQGCADCSNTCAYKIAMKARQDYANVPIDYRDKTLANNPSQIERQLDGYVPTFARQFDAEPEPIKSLYLYSAEPGTGKTTSAAVALNEWIARNYIGSLQRGLEPAQKPAYFLDVNEWQSLYNKFNRKNVSEEVALPASTTYYKQLKRAKTAPFAVLDDIGIRSATEAFRSDLHEIINHRVTNRLPTVYTSNVALKDLSQVFDKRLADRIGDLCLTITFDGESNRGRR